MTAAVKVPSIVVDGVEIPLLPHGADPLSRAVINSLFTWRRARADDKLPADVQAMGGSVVGARMGWWGDDLSSLPNDQFGSRLWLLRREALSPLTIERAREYAEEALEWLVDDGVAARVVVVPERVGKSQLKLRVYAYQHDGTVRELTFSDIWGLING